METLASLKCSGVSRETDWFSFRPDERSSAKINTNKDISLNFRRTIPLLLVVVATLFAAASLRAQNGRACKPIHSRFTSVPVRVINLRGFWEPDLRLRFHRNRYSCYANNFNYNFNVVSQEPLSKLIVPRRANPVFCIPEKCCHWKRCWRSRAEAFPVMKAARHSGKILRFLTT